MKQRLLTLFAAILMTSCAGVNITKTDIASGAANPKYIYIRPFAIKYATFTGNQGTQGQKAIRKSLAPITFAGMLQEELGKIAPAMVIDSSEMPEVGWLVEGEFECVDAGLPGNSHLAIHVRIIGVGDTAEQGSPKDSEKSGYSKHGRLLYEFDVQGGSTSSIGSVHAPGLGYAPTFDYRNAAERIMMELSVDPHRFGVRSSTTIRQ